MRENELRRNLLNTIFGEHNPYVVGEDVFALPLDVQGWGGHREFFHEMIMKSKPRTIVEVGSWKGKSAIAMAEILDHLYSQGEEWARDTQIICVDTWLGAPEFWKRKDDKKRFLSLNLKNGYPQVYYQFLKNVIGSGVEHRIIPFPQTSANAACFFSDPNMREHLKPDLIYIDGSHEYQDVADDLRNWDEVRRSCGTAGIMFGDDYCEYWRGVIDAVGEFANMNTYEVNTRQYENEDGQAPSDYWYIYL